MNNEAQLIHAGLLAIPDSGRTAARATCNLQDTFEMVWIKNGSGTVTIDFKDYRLSDHTLYCVCPGQVHGIQAKGGATGYKVVFSRAFYPFLGLPVLSGASLDFGSISNSDPLVGVGAPYRDELEAIVKAMIWESSRNMHMKNDVLTGMLTILCTLFFGQLQVETLGDPKDARHAIFRKFLTMVDTQFAGMKQVWEYADALAVSANYLSEIVKGISGRPASHFIHQRLVLEARRLAATSTMTMKEIAFHIGFQDPSQFSKFFKIRMGMNFSELRRYNACP